MSGFNGHDTHGSAITLSMPPEIVAAIQEIPNDSRLSIDEVFTRAIALYRESLRAISEGKHVGYADSDDSLEVEFTGLTAPPR